jgi:hypothetical protein
LGVLYSRHGNDWRVLDQFEYEQHCTRVLDSRVDEETRTSIGGALEREAADNPLRVQGVRPGGAARAGAVSLRPHQLTGGAGGRRGRGRAALRCGAQ